MGYSSEVCDWFMYCLFYLFSPPKFYIINSDYSVDVRNTSSECDPWHEYIVPVYRLFGGTCCLQLHRKLRMRVFPKTLVPVYQATLWYNPGDRNPNICCRENHGSRKWACYRLGRKWLDRDDESTWANCFSRFVLDFHLNSGCPWLCSGQSVI